MNDARPIARRPWPALVAAGWLVAAAPAAATAASAQGGTAPPTTEVVQGELLVALRVRAVLAEGRAQVDKGALDGLRAGDEVVLVSRTGERRAARVVDVAERSATVEATGLGAAFEPGMRGEALVPLARFAPTARSLEPEAAAPAAPGAEVPADDTRPPPSRFDEDTWKEGMPLLAGVRPPLPSERPPRFGGRIWSSFDAIETFEDGRSDRFARAGQDLFVENPFGFGGVLDTSLEWNHRSTHRPDEDDVDRSRLRVERFSYAHGGSRFEPHRFQAGRFLQHGMPFFGVLDGVEWSHRELGESSFGASAGFMPEPDPDYESGHDFQLAGWYRWFSDPTELASAAVGYQKTFHDGSADRDLVVIDAHHLPHDGWRSFATVWLDVYTSGDEAKGSGVEVTQALLQTSRAWERVDLGLTYSHLEYPQLDRDEFFPPVVFDQLADQAIDRLGADATFEVLDGTALVTRGGVWIDEDDDGADGELGVAISGLFGRASRLRSSVFGTKGSFVSVVGGRLGVGVWGDHMGVDLDYELSNQRLHGFESFNDDVRQQRGRLGFSWRPAPAWTVSAHADAVLIEDETSLLGGVFVQWTF